MADSVERRLAAILAADVIGYSRMMGADEIGTFDAFRSIRSRIVYPMLERHGGRIFKTTGDGLLAEFPSVVAAVECAVDIQNGMQAENADTDPDKRINFRIGINLGDVILEDGDIFGDGVNLASRLEGLAETGGICISRSVRDQIRDRLDYKLDDMGDITVKNFARPVRAFRVRLDHSPVAVAADHARPTAIRSSRARWAMGTSLLGLIFVLAGSLAVWQFTGRDGDGIETTNPLPDRPSIVVLPFQNTSGSAEQDYFSDGLTDDLITDLAKISALFVIGRDSAFAFKGEAPRVQEVARKLGVAYVVQGSVRRAGDAIRVNAQMVDARTGGQVWAERYDRKADDIFAVQDDLTSRIVSALSVRLTKSENMALRRQTSGKFEAYDLYLKGREAYFSGDQENIRASLDYFAEAIASDPDFARAYAGYALVALDIWRRAAIRETLSGATALAAAEAAANKALALDPNLAKPYSVLALMRMTNGRDQEAIELAQRAVKLEPNGADSHVALGIVLAYAGHLEDALESMTTANRLNPQAAAYQLTYYGLILFLNGRYADAAKTLEPIANVQDRGLGDSPQEILAMAYARLGRTAEARAQVAALHSREPFLNVAYYRTVYSHHARPEDLRRRIDALRSAGMPEWPLAFTAAPEQRISGNALGDLIDGKTWKGEDATRDLRFIQEFSAGGVVYASDETFLNGTAMIEDNELCERYEGFIQGKPLCGPIYRVTSSRNGKNFDYAYVNPTAVRYFSLDK